MAKLRLVEEFSIKTANMDDAYWADVVAFSFKKTGFAVIKNHKIPIELVDKVYADWSRFFSNPDKMAHLSVDGKGGYFPFKSENAKGNPIKDLKEFYHLHFPFDSVPEGIDADATKELTRQLLEIARNILWNIQINIPRELMHAQGETLHNMVKNSKSNLLRVLHYPPTPEDAEEGAVRAAAHEDINLLTLLVAATQPGLQVRDLDGRWWDIECEPGSLIVNVGDMLQEASGGRFISTTHRVVNPQGQNASRYSMPLFVHPRPECVLSKKYTAGQYLDERLKEIGLK
jgi:isopenicillin N synthase-like dioxygenase